MHFGVEFCTSTRQREENDAAPRCSCCHFAAAARLVPARSDKSCVTQTHCLPRLPIITFTAAAFLLFGFWRFTAFTLTFFFFP